MNQLNNESVSQTMEIRNIIKEMNTQKLYNLISKTQLSTNQLNIALSILTQNYRKESQFIEMLQILMKAGADINIPIVFDMQQPLMKIEEKDRMTVLMMAIIKNDIEMIKVLLKSTTLDINLIDARKRNAIIHAVTNANNGNADIIQLLLQEKADINSIARIEITPSISEIHSVYTYACLRNYLAIVKVLLERNVDHNFQVKPSLDTGLHIAVKRDYNQLVTLLLSHKNIIIETKNSEKLRPIDIAKAQQNTICYSLLMKYYQKELEKKSIQLTSPMTIMQQMNSNTQQPQNIMMSNTTPGGMGRNMPCNNQGMNNIAMNNMVINEGMNNIGMNIGIEHHQQQQLHNNMHGQYENSVHSSDIGENYEDDDNNNKDNKPDEKEIISYKTIEILQKTLSCTHAKKMNVNHNLEIPIEFKKYKQNNSKGDQHNSLSSFLTITNPPILSLDLTDKIYEPELQLNESSLQLIDINDKVKFLEIKIQEKEKKLKELIDKDQLKENELIKQKTLEEEQNKQIHDLTIQVNKLSKTLPKEMCDNPTKKNLSPAEYRETKFNPVKCEEHNVTKTLQKDLLDYKLFISEQIKQKKPLVNQLIKNIQMTTNEISQEYEVVLYGSYATDLCLPWSDLDVVIVNKTGGSIEHSFLSNLYQKIKSRDWVEQHKYIETTAIPIIKLVSTDDHNNMQIDISAQDDHHLGLKCVSLIKSFMNEYDVLEPLILALKTILKNANLNNPYLGGLSSYGLILMVVSYIQSQLDSGSYPDGDDKLGRVFYNVLCHYGICFDFHKYVILTYLPKDKSKAIIEKDTTNLDFTPTSQELIIVDPLNFQNNVAKSSFQFMNLKMAFMIAFMVTKEDCECGCHYGRALHEHSHFSTEHCILKRMFNSVKRFSDTNKG